jgi:hypothetical protein
LRPLRKDHVSAFRASSRLKSTRYSSKNPAFRNGDQAWVANGGMVVGDA